MSEPFLGQIEFFAFTLSPKGWLPCAGQTLPIAQNQALFSLIGVTFGGNGVTTFMLPNLVGRLPVGQGQGSATSSYPLGAIGGTEGVVLTTAQIPSHTHAVNVVPAPPSTPVASPAGNLLSVVSTATDVSIYGSGTATGPMAVGTVANGGGSQPHENRMPYLALNPCIAIAGIFPTRP